MSRYLSSQQFDTLLRPVRPALLRSAVRRVGLNAADDCVQNGIISAWTRLSRLPEGFTGGDFAKLCFSCVQTACRSHVRELTRLCTEPYLSPDDLLLAIEHSEADSTLALPSLACALYDALRDELTALLLRVPLTALQETCVRRWMQGETQQKIADYWGVTQEMVRCHIAAGIKKLKAERERSEEHLDTDLARFFFLCIEDVKRSIYRKPSHGSTPRTGGKPYRQRTDKAMTRSERQSCEAKQRQRRDALLREEGVLV